MDACLCLESYHALGSLWSKCICRKANTNDLLFIFCIHIGKTYSSAEGEIYAENNLQNLKGLVQ